MPAFPAYCPNCNAIFPLHGIGVVEGATATIGFKNVVTKCPVCTYGQARVADGVYQANSTAIQVLSAPESTLTIIEAFKKLVEQAATGQISLDEAIQKANDLSPRYAGLLDSFVKLGLPGLGLLATLITCYLQYEGDKSSTQGLNNILNAVTEQTLVLKKHVYISKVEQQSAAPTHHKTKRKSSFIKNPSKRRTDVNKQRHAALKQRREAFGGARRH